MSDQAETPKANVSQRRERIRVRVESLRRAPKLGIFGLPELIALGTSLVLLAVVLFTYFYIFTPASARHVRALQQRDALQLRLREAQGVFTPLADTGATVAAIDKSLQDFEETRLSPSDEGRMAIYQELNELILRNGLRATGGVNYSSLDPLGQQAQQGTFGNVTRSTSSKWQSVYPGLGINLTVEGPYANMRRFVRDIEATRQFIIINAVELEGVTDSAAARAAVVPGEPGSASAPQSSIVSLRLDMAAYFRRTASNTGTGQ